MQRAKEKKEKSPLQPPIEASRRLHESDTEPAGCTDSNPRPKAGMDGSPQKYPLFFVLFLKKYLTGG
jgi:hypothetical protein